MAPNQINPSPSPALPSPFPREDLLLELFLACRASGLPLQLADYQLVLQAWAAGHQPTTWTAWRSLLRRLWAKSRSEQSQYDRALDQYLQQQAAGLTDLLFEEQPTPSSSSAPLREQPTPSSSMSCGQAKPTAPLREQPAPSSPPQVVSAIQPGPWPDLPTIAPGRFSRTADYFPLSLRRLAQGWRYLQAPQRQGTSTDVDIPATVDRLGQQGFLLDLVCLPTFVNRLQLVLLVDHSNSMAPFHLLTESLITTAQHSPDFPQPPQVYYFRNVGDDRLYRDPDLWQPQPLSRLTPSWHPHHTVVLILSDAGAARGGWNPHRCQATQAWLATLRPNTRHLVWLNPLPSHRWQGTTAQAIAQEMVPMFEFSDSGWRSTLRALQGQLRASTPYVLRTGPANDSAQGTPQPIAHQQITAFAARGKGYLHLAYHAAFPLAITPDLLYYLRHNFPTDEQGTPLDIPWLAIPDLLLSSLCHPAGDQLYEMDSTVRHQLLSQLQADPHFGNDRLAQLSDALLFYVQQGIQHRYRQPADLGERPDWIALAYTAPSQFARQLAQTLQQNYTHPNACLRLATLAATLADPLIALNYQPLLTLTQGLAHQARGNPAAATALFRQLPPTLTVEGIQLPNPLSSPFDSAQGTSPFTLHPSLPTFSFEVVTTNDRGDITNREQRQAQYQRVDLGKGVFLDMVRIPGGEFLMGAAKGEAGASDDEYPQHRVTVPAFFMAKTPVTQSQYQAIVGNNPSRFTENGANRPVEQVKWKDAMEFCEKLSKKTGQDYRLPSEAEWEYACRAGTTTPFYFGPTITPDLVNYNGNYPYGKAPKGEYRQQTTEVGSFSPNAFGLYDLHGNVYEWCADNWHPNYESAPTDGSIWKTKDFDNDDHVLRGGSWIDFAVYCRSAFRDRFGFFIDGFDGDVGFRVVASSALRT